MNTLLRIIIVLTALLPLQATASVSFRSFSEASAANSAITVTSGAMANMDGCGNITPAIPAGSIGDLLIAQVVARRNAATVTMPGWNTLFSDNVAGQNYQAILYYRSATSAVANGDPRTISQSGTSCDLIMARITRFGNVDTAQPLEFAAGEPPLVGNSAYSDANNVDTGTQDVSVVGSMLMLATFANDNRTLTENATFTELYDDASRTGDDGAISLNYRVETTTGTKGPFNNMPLSGGTPPNHGVLFAVRPATTSSLTINVPAGASSGDVMIASVAVNPSSVTITAPAGWTLIRQTAQGAGNSSRLATYYRVAGASEPASYSWTLNGAHAGAVGGIMSFSGVDNTSPIDVENGAATNSSLNHQAPSLTTGQDDGMLVTVHEYASSSTWTAPGGMTEAVDIASLTPNNTAGISMQMNYEARPTAGATGTRTAVASANADTGATQSISLRPSPLVCFGDDFNRANGPPGTDWIVSSTSGTFGNPVIFNNRLRLTNASGDVSTMATLQQLFPGAGNRIEVEFQHFAYGGSGADGIAVVFSDASVTPSPGAFGGSLGYAQKTIAGGAPANIPGFAGGWLGVGIDEFGNYSNPTEGRVLGPGARADSVAIRGSGSGFGNTQYRYHTGTAANLNPQVDNNGAASPPHKYRIILDHSNGVNAYVSVERDTGSGYVTLIPSYDAKAQTGQVEVPTNWIVSYTASTGGATNIHEIDGLRICATSQMPVSPIDHFSISHDGSAVNCQAEAITIAGHESDHTIDTTYTGTLTLSTSTNRGDWTIINGNGTLNNGAPNDGAATYAMVVADNGDVVLGLKNTTVETLSINVTDGTVSESPTEDANLTFAQAGFQFLAAGTANNINNQIAGKPSNIAPWDQTLELQAIRTNNLTGACEAALTGNVAIEMAFECENPTTCSSRQVSINGSNINGNSAGPIGSYSNITLDFGDNTDTTATFTLNYPDAGQVQLHARYNIPLDDGSASPSGVYMNGSSNSFVVRPFGYDISASGNPGATGPGGTVYTIAGSDFTVNAEAVLWEAADDSDNDGIPDGHQSADINPANNANLTDNLIALNYGQEQTVESIMLVSALNQPAGGQNPTLGGTSTIDSFTNGAGSTTVNYSEVGIIEISGNNDDYLVAGLGIIGKSGYVGRFRPNHFSVSAGAVAPRIDIGCTTSTFTYMGENLELGFTLTSHNAQGGVTQNYIGSFAKLDPTDPNDLNFGAVDSAGPTPLSGRIVPGVVAGSWTNGTTNILARVALARIAGPDGPYQNLFFGIAPDDGEGVTLAVAGLNLDVDNDAANDHGRINNIASPADVRYGRLFLENAFGSELLPLALPLYAEYYTGTQFVLNTNDSCTSYSSADITFANRSGLTADPTPGGAGALIGGRYDPNNPIILSAPGAGNTGSIDAILNVLPYLHYDWTTDGNLDGAEDDDPFSKATFGIYGGPEDNQIYIREVY